MIRFIMRRKTRDNASGLETSGLETFDAECPELEKALLYGGSGESGFLYVELVGAEVREGLDNGQ